MKDHVSYEAAQTDEHGWRAVNVCLLRGYFFFLVDFQRMSSAGVPANVSKSLTVPVMFV